MDDRESIPYAFPKRENDNEIGDRETILCPSLRRENKDEINEKIYKKPKPETPAEIEKKKQ